VKALNLTEVLAVKVKRDEAKKAKEVWLVNLEMMSKEEKESPRRRK
jgi:hypothetical protein